MNWKEKQSLNLFVLISVFCLGILLHCASFVHYENPTLKNQPKPEILEKKTILIKYYGDFYEKGQFSKHPQAIPEINENIADILKESNMFKKVVTNENEPHDLIMYVETNIDEKASKIFAVISGLTVLAIPLKMDQDYHMKISLLDSKKKLLAFNEERFNIDIFVGWIIIPISPFFFTPVVHSNANRNVIYSSLNQWKSKGIIK
ncbi:hypothetical protein ND861_15250 [Leptospira sp. 2 VSF19]|uniref:Lipoprotein n=1 Tax=Leptospira soteropolitanensis TaxID=2950025 RepID=A0AAW5VK34_9LEPT|nr:hypothetical protein [Leptospira soteropolitanensis]MCW7494002.1 hypothetical protein [Leptospira soteropolitanensis]MCW7501732.1 hypothetical protein [Leptospira soteropolitanensis]MCW7523848.1 hypothetical protein [Leptospira soteropolitanensis]MCW7527713.1 hypothetical protein [Leptospira soteropolitanensis]MCW7531702.1 hypothetical protein [Leptospira soteropolitanensis]